MKKQINTLSFSHYVWLLLTLVLFCTGDIYGQLFRQDFDGTSENANGNGTRTITATDYYADTDASNSQFNLIATNGKNASFISINSNTAGELVAGGNDNSSGYIFNRDESLASVSPTAIKITFRMKYDVTNTSSSISKFYFQIGSDFTDLWNTGSSTSQGKEPDENVFAGFSLCNVHSTNGATLRHNDGTTSIQSAIGEDYNLWTIVINNSGSALNYTDPLSASASVADKSMDIWIGNELVGDEIAAITTTQKLDHFKFGEFVVSAGRALFYMDWIQIDDISPSASTTYHYRSSSSGSWSDIARWEYSVDSVSWTSALASPTAGTATSVIIQDEHNISVDVNSTASALRVKAGGKLILNDGRSLNLESLFLESTSTGQAVFVDKNETGGLTVSGNTTVQQYLTGSLLTVGENSAPNGRMWYLATPVKGVKSDVFDAEGVNKLWSYSELTKSYTEITNNTTDLEIGTGYVARLGASSTVNFSSAEGLHTGNKVIALPYNEGEKAGYTLVGNPYPSFLDWDAVQLNENVMPTIWIRSFSGSAMGFDTYNSVSKLATTQNLNTVTKYIAPLQAFWVEASANSEITLTNVMRFSIDHAHAGNQLKVPAFDDNRIVLRLSLSNSMNSDEVVLAFIDGALDTYDRYDSRKMFSNTDELPELFSVVDDYRLAINSMSKPILNQDYSLGISLLEANTLVLKAIDFQNLENYSIVLIDKLLNCEIDLSAIGSYSFSSDPTFSVDRFSIQFRVSNGATGIDNLPVNDVRLISVRKGQIDVQFNELPTSAVAEVYSVTGQLLSKQSLNDIMNPINRLFESGIYIIKVELDGRTVIDKVHVK